MGRFLLFFDYRIRIGNRLYVSALTDKLDLSVAEHSVIVTAIEAGDGDTAQRAIHTNWRNAAKRVGALINEWGESGGW